MSSTDLEAPSRKLTLTAIAVVVGLHALTAIALAAVETPELKVDKKEIPPIEIELITLPPPPPPVEVQTVNLEEEPTPAPQVKEQPPAPKAKPVAQPKPKAPAKPVVKEENITPKAKPVAPIEKPEVNNPPKEPVVDPKIAEAAANEQRRIIAAQAERAAQQAQAQKDRDAQIAANAKAAREAEAAAQANREAQAAKAAAEAKAAKEAAAQAARDAQAAASNTPVSFSASNASWRSGREPDLSFLEKAAKVLKKDVSIKVKITADENGNIVDAELLSRTGNDSIDGKIRRAMMKAKLNPYIKNGVAVKGTVILPIAYKVK